MTFFFTNPPNITVLGLGADDLLIVQYSRTSTDPLPRRRRELRRRHAEIWRPPRRHCWAWATCWRSTAAGTAGLVASYQPAVTNGAGDVDLRDFRRDPLHGTGTRGHPRRADRQRAFPGRATRWN